MRILYVIDHLGLGGAQTALAELVAHWPEDDDHLTVVGLGTRRDLLPRFESNPRVRVEALGYRRWNPSALRRVEQIARADGSDLVHAHLCKSLLAGLWVKSRTAIPLVMHLHGDPQHDARYIRWTLRWGWRRADAMIAVSQHTKRATSQQLGIPEERMHLIYNPLADRKPDRSESLQQAAELRRSLGIAPERVVLGYVGRLTDIKGLNYLLQALDQIRASHGDVHAILVGDGPEADRLKADAAQRGMADRVHLVGVQSDVTVWLDAFDVAVFPSLTEGLPLAVLEAMQAGLPVIASSVGGIPEVIEDDQSGLLLLPGDADPLARAIVALADSADVRQRLGLAAGEEVSARFAADRVSRQVRDFYVQLLQN